MWFKSAKVNDKSTSSYAKDGLFNAFLSRSGLYESSVPAERNIQSNDLNERLYRIFASRNAETSQKSPPYDLDVFGDFLYNQLLQEHFTYGDVPAVKYSVESFFKTDESQAFMVFINIASNKVFSSSPDVIEKFFALVSSLEKDVALKVYMTVVLIFLSHKDASSAEGSLLLLEKFGRGKEAYDNALLIRKFQYDYLNKYKDDVISYLRGTF